MTGSKSTRAHGVRHLRKHQAHLATDWATTNREIAELGYDRQVVINWRRNHLHEWLNAGNEHPTCRCGRPFMHLGNCTGSFAGKALGTTYAAILDQEHAHHAAGPLGTIEIARLTGIPTEAVRIWRRRLLAKRAVAGTRDECACGKNLNHRGMCGNGTPEQRAVALEHMLAGRSTTYARRTSGLPRPITPDNVTLDLNAGERDAAVARVESLIRDERRRRSDAVAPVRFADEDHRAIAREVGYGDERADAIQAGYLALLEGETNASAAARTGRLAAGRAARVAWNAASLDAPLGHGDDRTPLDLLASSGEDDLAFDDILDRIDAERADPDGWEAFVRDWDEREARDIVALLTIGEMSALPTGTAHTAPTTIDDASRAPGGRASAAATDDADVVDAEIAVLIVEELAPLRGMLEMAERDRDAHLGRAQAAEMALAETLARIAEIERSIAAIARMVPANDDETPVGLAA